MRLAAAVLSLLLLPGTAGAATITETARATPVDADAGRVLWSAYDDATQRYRLMLRDVNGAVRGLPVAPSREPFDADLGDDARRRPAVAYTRCATRCEVRVLRLDGTGAARIAASARRDTHAPTISDGRVAWVEGGSYRDRPRVRIATLGSRRAPQTLPALAPRRCSRTSGRCGGVTGTVDELELRGDALAQISTSYTAFSQLRELRVVSVRRRTSRPVLDFTFGEGGQALIGASLDGRYLYAYKTCEGDPGGCAGDGGTYRHRLSGGGVERATTARPLSGFSVDRGRAFRAEGAETEGCELDADYLDDPTIKPGPCPLTEEPLPSRWRRHR